MPQRDLTLIVVIPRKTYQVWYYFNGGVTGNGEVNLTYDIKIGDLLPKVNTKIIFNTEDLNNKNLDSWYCIIDENTDEGKIWDFDKDKFELNYLMNKNSFMILLLRWNYYTVKYFSKGNQSIINMPQDSTFLDGKSIEKPKNPSRDGYNFIGWRLVSCYSGQPEDKIFDFKQLLYRNIEFEAEWQKTNEKVFKINKNIYSSYFKVYDIINLININNFYFNSIK